MASTVNGELIGVGEVHGCIHVYTGKVRTAHVMRARELRKEVRERAS